MKQERSWKKQSAPKRVPGKCLSSVQISSFRVTEFKFCRDIGNIFRGNNGHTLTDLQDLTTDFIPAEDAVAFIDNHDNQRGHGAGGIQIITFREPTLYVMANAFELAWPYGYVRIMSSYVWPLDVEVNIHRAKKQLERANV